VGIGREKQAKNTVLKQEESGLANVGYTYKTAGPCSPKYILLVAKAAWED
jgi:hypothetical protein